MRSWSRGYSEEKSRLLLPRKHAWQTAEIRTSRKTGIYGNGRLWLRSECGHVVMALYFAQWLFVAISIRGNQANRQIVVRLRHSQRRFSSQVGGLSAFLPDSKCNSSEELRRLTILNSTQRKYSDDTPDRKS